MLAIIDGYPIGPSPHPGSMPRSVTFSFLTAWASSRLCNLWEDGRGMFGPKRKPQNTAYI